SEGVASVVTSPPATPSKSASDRLPPEAATARTASSVPLSPSLALSAAARPAQAPEPSVAQTVPLGDIIEHANRALAQGEMARALALAHEAVAADPGNADAWLILGAALQASNAPAAAREAYRACVSNAHTANLSECRLLEER
ncbi:MAG: tetratricopeptide repeat protein, partial [Polyangiaceae bacterium]